ncbi:hypothetical protein N7465_002117 [Penicillium sp. CMV-2018d]|nr:hypothetical protein N7465_002117 [Penicillium sp. CMV-2018d]
MAPSPSRIAAQEGDAYADSTMIKMQRLIHTMNLSTTETTIKEFHDTLCKKSLQDIAWIHAQFDYPNPFPISSEEPTESLINPCVEYRSLIHEMQALQGQMGLLNSVVTLPNLPATETDNLPTLARINLFRGEVDLPLIKNIPVALRLARPIELTLSDVTSVRTSELKDIIGWYKRAHLYLEVEAARCKTLLGSRHRDPLKKPNHGVISHPPFNITQIPFHEDDYDKLATKSQLDGNEKSSKPATTIKQRKRKNRKRKNKDVVNGTPSQDSPSPTESGAPVNELAKKNTISPDLLAFPTSPIPCAISTEPDSSPHCNPIRARSITARERDLLDSLYEMLVECANRTETRALQSAEAQTLTLGSHFDTIVGQDTAQRRKNNHHSKEARKRRQAIQRRRKRDNPLTVTIPSLSPHIVNPELSSPGPSFETPNNKIQEVKRPLSAPPVLSPSQPKTITYTGSPFVNPRNRPASASGNLPLKQTIQAVSVDGIYG